MPFLFVACWCMGLVGLYEQGFLGDGTELKMLKTDISLERQ